MNPSTMEPIDFPKLNIRGVEYSLIFGGGAQLRMERLGYPYYQVQIAQANKTAILPTVAVYTWLAAMAVLPFEDGTYEWAGVTADQLADLYPPSQHLAAFSKLCMEAIKKVQPTINTPSQTSAKPETETLVDDMPGAPILTN